VESSAKATAKTRAFLDGIEQRVLGKGTREENTRTARSEEMAASTEIVAAVGTTRHRCIVRRLPWTSRARRAHTLLAAYPQEPSLAGTVRGAVRVRGAGWRAEHTHRRG